jgi:hypothetical protein
MARETLTSEDKRNMLSLLVQNVAYGRYEGLVNYARRLNRTKFSKAQVLKFNADIDFMPEKELLEVLAENTEGVTALVRERARQQNVAIFKASRARQAYANEHQYDRYERFPR